MAEISLSDIDISLLLRNFKGKNTNVVSYSISPLGDVPIGFLGNHLLLNLEFEDGDKEIRTKRFFVKTTPQIDLNAEYVESIGAFKKEVILFDSVIPELLKETAFLEHAWAPLCHIAKDNLLLFDDLSEQNYQLAKQTGLFDLEHCVAVLRTLADFHAASIIYEHKRATKIDQMFPEAVKEVCYILEEGHVRNKWLKSVTAGCVYLCSKMGHAEKSHLLPGIFLNSISNIGPSVEWCNVLSHGDLWGNNFMFKYDEHNNIQHCIIVDYQLARYAPCALDVMCCLHLISSRKMRESHLPDLIRNVYYARLRDVLKRAGLNCEEILPLLDFEKGCAKYKQLALVEACCYGTIIWVPGKLAAEIVSDPARCMEIAIGDRTSLLKRSYEEDDFFRNQMTDLIEELLQLST